MLWVSIHLSSSLILVKRRATGDRWPADEAADVKSNVIIEISGPNNPKIDTGNDISAIFYFFL